LLSGYFALSQHGHTLVLHAHLCEADSTSWVRSFDA
jgi:hypothetical protein